MFESVRLPVLGRMCGLISVAALVIVTAGCSATKDPTSLADVGHATASGHGVLTWIFTEPALSDVLVDPGVRKQLGPARIFELAHFKRRPPADLGLIPTVKFASYASMKETLDSGGLPPWVKAILYDDEAWAYTPAAEQRSPGLYMAMAAKLAHQHHLLFLTSPALNLTTVAMRRSGSSQKAAAYLKLHLAAQAAEAADVFNIQAQSLERSTRAYVEFVRKAAAQAKRAKPGVTILAGISSNPTGPQVTAAQLNRAIIGVRPYVDGYWMNIPSPGPLCPGCNQARPDLAIGAIRSLSG